MKHLSRRFSGYIYLYVAIAFIVTQAVIGLTMMDVRYSPNVSFTVMKLISMLITYLPLLVIIAVRKYPVTQTLRIKTFSVRYVWYSIGIGICLFLFIHFLNLLVSNLISTIAYQMEPDYFHSSYHSLWPYVLTSCLIPAFFETMIFQGAIQSGLHCVKPLKACLTVGILFGLLIAGSNSIIAGSSVSTVLYFAIYGFSLSYISIQSGSIIPGMIAGFTYYLFSYGDFEDLLYQYCLSPLGISELVAAIGLLVLAAVIGGLLLFKLPKTHTAAKPLSMPSLSIKKIRDRLTQPWLPVPLDKETQAAETPSVDMAAASVAEAQVIQQGPLSSGGDTAKNKNRGFIIGVVLLAVLALAASGYAIYMMVTQYGNTVY